MNTKFEEFKELTNYDMIDTYYDEIKDFKYFISDLQEDRVESQKYIVNANEEIKRLNNKIDKAIEYIEKTRNTLLLSYPPKEAFDIDKLLDILTESDSNENE